MLGLGSFLPLKYNLFFKRLLKLGGEKMGKISLVAAKYIVHANITIDGVVDRPDVIGAIFGQTEGLLGSELELRELQRNGKIGRIEVNMETRSGKSSGEIIIPSSLDKAETAIISAALETIQRIGPCNAKVKTGAIEDVRVSKRTYVVDRAKELLKDLTEKVLPDSQEITEEVSHSVRMMEIEEYGKDRLPCGPLIEDSDEVIVVEGRADVLNLLKYGIKNVIALNGTSVPQTIVDLSKQKIVTAFLDGDRGGDLIIKELKQIAEIDFIARAPDGKEVEEITKKEINKALRSKIAFEQVELEVPKTNQRSKVTKSRPQRREFVSKRPQLSRKKARISPKELEVYKEILDGLVGTRGAYILDEGLNILGKVPISEVSTIKNLGSDVHAIVFDGIISRDVVRVAERMNTKHLVAMDSKVSPQQTKISLLTKKDF